MHRNLDNVESRQISSYQLYLSFCKRYTFATSIMLQHWLWHCHCRCRCHCRSLCKCVQVCACACVCLALLLCMQISTNLKFVSDSVVLSLVMQLQPMQRSKWQRSNIVEKHYPNFATQNYFQHICNRKMFVWEILNILFVFNGRFGSFGLNYNYGNRSKDTMAIDKVASY